MAVKPLLNEDELLRKIADGEQRAFRTVYDHYYNNIYAYALYLIKSDVLAEEIVQEAFLKLWLQGAELNNIKNTEGFLIAVTRNGSLDVLRRMTLEARFVRNQVLDWKETHNDTEERVILNDGRRILQKGIDLLPPQQKSVYQLCYQQGMKYKEAAQQLDLSVGTVKSYMKLALKNLRDFLAKNSDLAALLIIFKLF